MQKRARSSKITDIFQAQNERWIRDRAKRKREDSEKEDEEGREHFQT